MNSRHLGGHVVRRVSNPAEAGVEGKGHEGTPSSRATGDRWSGLLSARERDSVLLLRGQYLAKEGPER